MQAYCPTAPQAAGCSNLRAALRADLRAAGRSSASARARASSSIAASSLGSGNAAPSPAPFPPKDEESDDSPEELSVSDFPEKKPDREGQKMMSAEPRRPKMTMRIVMRAGE